MTISICRLCDHYCDDETQLVVVAESGSSYHGRCYELMGHGQWQRSDGRHRREALAAYMTRADQEHDQRRDFQAEMWANGGPF